RRSRFESAGPGCSSTIARMSRARSKEMRTRRQRGAISRRSPARKSYIRSDLFRSEPERERDGHEHRDRKNGSENLVTRFPHLPRPLKPARTVVRVAEDGIVPVCVVLTFHAHTSGKIEAQDMPQPLEQRRHGSDFALIAVSTVIAAAFTL